ncbi:MAG: hypothetical protein JRI23_33400 [Deltaproteobacteria bacterium]|nr:hypothetical protein [Deltaproteobacteria bacterium]MBW2537176.1 hypothetical protein [Deltaproteobacteria bacterium]
MTARARWWAVALVLATVPSLGCHVRVGQKDPAAQPQPADRYVKPYATSPAYGSAGGAKEETAKPPGQAGSAAATAASPTGPPKPPSTAAVPAATSPIKHPLPEQPWEPHDEPADEPPDEVPDMDLLDEVEEVEDDPEVPLPE